MSLNHTQNQSARRAIDERTAKIARTGELTPVFVFRFLCSTYGCLRLVNGETKIAFDCSTADFGNGSTPDHCTQRNIGSAPTAARRPGGPGRLMRDLTLLLFIFFVQILDYLVCVHMESTGSSRHQIRWQATSGSVAPWTSWLSYFPSSFS